MNFAVRHNLPDCAADNIHFGGGEPIPTREVTWRAGRTNITLDMWQGVVNTVKAARTLCSPAVNTWLHYVSEDLGGRKIAGVNFLIRRSQKDSPPPVSFRVSLLSRFRLGALVWRLIFPAVRAIIAPALPAAVAGSALIGQSKGAGRITQENLRVRGQELFTAIAVAKAIFWGDKSFSHRSLLARISSLVNTAHIRKGK